MLTMDNILNSTCQVPPLPEISRMVLQLVDDPKSSAADIVRIVRHDQATTANVLRLCNSAFFGLKRKIDSLSEAVVLIGQNQLVELVMISSCMHLFRNGCGGGRTKKGRLWRHSIASALLSQVVLRHMARTPDPGLYTAALLHDIGRVVLDHCTQGGYDKVMSVVAQESMPIHVAEKIVFGVDHAEVGAHVMEAWNLPPNIVNGIRLHHDTPATLNPQDFASVIYFCDLVCPEDEKTEEGDRAPLAQILGATDLADAFLESCTKDLNAELEKLGTAFEFLRRE